MVNPREILRLCRSNLGTRRTATARLSNAPLDMLRCLDDGLTMKYIAASTGISVHTVHSHLRGAYNRLNTNGSNNAVALAIRAGLI